MPKSTVPSPASRLVEEAFRIGREIVEAEGGYHFAVHTEGGHTFVGCPDDYDNDGLLFIDSIDGPTPVIDINRIVAITVINVVREHG